MVSQRVDKNKQIGPLLHRVLAPDDTGLLDRWHHDFDQAKNIVSLVAQHLEDFFIRLCVYGVWTLLCFYSFCLTAVWLRFTFNIFIRSMVRVQKRIAVGMEVLQYFTMRGWNFKIENTKALVNCMNEEDKKKFYVQNVEVDIEKYMIQVMLGARQYCMKEPLTNLDRARYHLKL